MPKNWVMAPYEHNSRKFNQVWKYDRENGVISIGWNVGYIESPEELSRTYWQDPVSNSEGWGEYGLKQLTMFWSDIKPRDRIIARAGRMRIADVGTVIGTPFYDARMGVEQEGDHAYFLPVR